MQLIFISSFLFSFSMMLYLKKLAVVGCVFVCLAVGLVVLSQLYKEKNNIQVRDFTKETKKLAAERSNTKCKPKIIYKDPAPCDCEEKICKEPKECKCEKCKEPEPCLCKSEKKNTTTVNPYKKEVRFPDSIIIGEMKCGTSAMQFFLKFHPDIAMSKKEVDFFSVRFKWGWDWYKKMLPEATPSQIVMEKSVYFGSEVQEEAWRRIYEYNPNIKMILNLRDPVDRTISQFNMKSKESNFYYNRKLEDFIYERNNSQLINKTHYFISRGHYYTNMLRWIKYFPLRQILIVESETFKKDPLSELVKVEKHLGLRPFFNKEILFFDKQKGFFCLKFEDKINCLPDWASNPKRPVSEKVINDLKRHYQPEVKKFYELIGRKFNWDVTK